MYASYSSYNNDSYGSNVDQNGVMTLESIEQRVDLVSKNKIVCIEIYADWCGPCKTLAPAYASMAIELKDKYGAVLVKLNHDKLPSIEKQHYQAVPMFDFYFNGTRLPENVIGGDLKKVEEIIINLYKQSQSQFSNSSFSRNAIRNYKPNI